jgi:hypothetical protein
LTEQWNHSSLIQEGHLSFNETGAVVCHHPTVGKFEIFCPHCRGSAFKDPDTDQPQFLSGPLALFTHIRRLHPSHKTGELGAFLEDLLNIESCYIRRRLTIDAATKATVDGLS